MATDYWAVTVNRRGEDILTIASHYLSGKPELTAEDEQCIRDCAQSLLAFVGEPPAAPASTPEPRTGPDDRAVVDWPSVRQHPIAEPPTSTPDPLRCYDCGAPYSTFGLDTTIPDEQWARLFPGDNSEAVRCQKGGGILCASCMVKRAARLPGAVAVRAVIDSSGGDVDAVVPRESGPGVDEIRGGLL
jgi:hypothetical protein